MNRALFPTLGVVSFVLALTGPAKAEPISLAVMPLQPQGGVSQETVRILDDLLANQMTAYPAYEVITSKDIESMLGLDALKQSFNCNASSCTAQIGGALGVTQLITGSVSKLGSKIIVSLTRLNAAEAKVLGRGSATTDAKDEDQLIEGLAQAVKTIMSNKKNDGPALGHPPHSETHSSLVGTDSTVAMPSTLTLTFWLAGAWTTAGGAVLWNQALTFKDESQDHSIEGSQRKVYDANQKASRAHLLFGVGGALLTAGFVNWLLFDEDHNHTSASITMTPSSTTVSIGGSW